MYQATSPAAGGDPDLSRFAKRAITTIGVAAPAEVTWRVVASIGGRRGYFFATILWRLRGAIDRAVGGPGMRGRGDPASLRVGDIVDFWRVGAVEPGRRLMLRGEMRLPGRAVQRWEVEALPADRSRLTMTAAFAPSGVFGLLYWWAMAPAHLLIFRRMPANIARAAERLALAERQAAAP